MPEYVNGENFRLLSSLQIPIGRGSLGLGGADRKDGGERQSGGGIAGTWRTRRVPARCGPRWRCRWWGSRERSACSRCIARIKMRSRADHLRVLLAVTSKVSLALENALKFRQVETTATTDYLTELPNARSLFLRLDSELARSKRASEPLDGAGVRPGRLQDGQRSPRPPGGQQGAARGGQCAARKLPRIRLRGAHGRRRIRADSAGERSRQHAAADRGTAGDRRRPRVARSRACR